MRHVEAVERRCFQLNFERREAPLLFSVDHQPDLDFDPHEDVDLRWLVLRMITEDAQRCGHLDPLRGGVDGRTGA